MGASPNRLPLYGKLRPSIPHTKVVKLLKTLGPNKNNMWQSNCVLRPWISSGFQRGMPVWDLKGGSLSDHILQTSLDGGSPQSKAWFALRVKSRHEKLVGSAAQQKGFEEFVPLYQSRRRWSDRVKSVDLPLFPGYVFCRLDPQHRLPLLTIPGVLHMVGIGKAPMPIDESEIATIRAAVQSGLSVEPWDFLEAGQRVRLE